MEGPELLAEWKWLNWKWAKANGKSLGRWGWGVLVIGLLIEWPADHYHDQKLKSKLKDADNERARLVEQAKNLSLELYPWALENPAASASNLTKFAGTEVVVLFKATRENDFDIEYFRTDVQKMFQLAGWKASFIPTSASLLPEIRVWANNASATNSLERAAQALRSEMLSNQLFCTEAGGDFNAAYPEKIVMTLGDRHVNRRVQKELRTLFKEQTATNTPLNKN